MLEQFGRGFGEEIDRVAGEEERFEISGIGVFEEVCDSVAEGDGSGRVFGEIASENGKVARFEGGTKFAGFGERAAASGGSEIYIPEWWELTAQGVG